MEPATTVMLATKTWRVQLFIFYFFFKLLQVYTSTPTKVPLQWDDQLHSFRLGGFNVMADWHISQVTI